MTNYYVRIYAVDDGVEEVIESVCINEDCIDEIVEIINENNVEEK